MWNSEELKWIEQNRDALMDWAENPDEVLKRIPGGVLDKSTIDFTLVFFLLVYLERGSDSFTLSVSRLTDLAYRDRGAKFQAFLHTPILNQLESKICISYTTIVASTELPKPTLEKIFRKALRDQLLQDFKNRFTKEINEVVENCKIEIR